MHHQQHNGGISALLDRQGKPLDTVESDILKSAGAVLLITRIAQSREQQEQG